VGDRAATREAFNRALVEFVTTLVRTRSRAPRTLASIDESTLLFESGLIDSLGILELLAFVEKSTGQPIPIHKVDVQCFGTVDRISRSFWREE
jgi:hypothetical protein